ncbi:MAG: hypothetical protein ABJG47_16015 [Ekhidna sp.]
MNNKIRIANIILVVISFFWKQDLLAQEIQLPRNYCSNPERGMSISQGENVLNDTILIRQREEVDRIIFQFYNTTSETVFLFSSYFEDLYYSSRHLHRVDTNSLEYKISFIPLNPFLKTISSDRIKFVARDAVISNQNLYDFIKIQPYSFFELEIPYRLLFKNIDNEDSCVSVIDEDQNTLFGNIDFQILDKKSVKSKLDLQFEFAVYESVDFLCNRTAYWEASKEFEKQAMGLQKFIVPVQLEYFMHSLIN